MHYHYLQMSQVKYISGGRSLDTCVQGSTVVEFLAVIENLGIADSFPFNVKEIGMEMVNVYRLHFSTGDKINVSLEPSINWKRQRFFSC